MPRLFEIDYMNIQVSLFSAVTHAIGIQTGPDLSADVVRQACQKACFVLLVERKEAGAQAPKGSSCRVKG